MAPPLQGFQDGTADQIATLEALGIGTGAGDAGFAGWE